MTFLYLEVVYIGVYYIVIIFIFLVYGLSFLGLFCQEKILKENLTQFTEVAEELERTHRQEVEELVCQYEGIFESRFCGRWFLKMLKTIRKMA